MKAIVLGVRNGRAALLLEDGTTTYRRMQCKPGQRVEVPEENAIIASMPHGMKAAAAAVALFLVLGGTYFQTALPVSYITMDVNPSMEYALNRSDRVVEVSALNEDAKAIVEELSVSGERIGDAVEKAEDVLEEHGYLRDGGSVLFSVSSNDDTHSGKLEKELTGAMDKRIQKKEKSDLEYSVVRVSKDEREEAKKLSISAGRFKQLVVAHGTESASDKSLVQEFSHKPIDEMIGKKTVQKNGGQSSQDLGSRNSSTASNVPNETNVLPQEGTTNASVPAAGSKEEMIDKSEMSKTPAAKSSEKSVTQAPTQQKNSTAEKKLAQGTPKNPQNTPSKQPEKPAAPAPTQDKVTQEVQASPVQVPNVQDPVSRKGKGTGVSGGNAGNGNGGDGALIGSDNSQGQAPAAVAPATIPGTVAEATTANGDTASQTEPETASVEADSEATDPVVDTAEKPEDTPKADKSDVTKEKESVKEESSTAKEEPVKEESAKTKEDKPKKDRPDDVAGKHHDGESRVVESRESEKPDDLEGEESQVEEHAVDEPFLNEGDDKGQSEQITDEEISDTQVELHEAFEEEDSLNEDAVGEDALDEEETSDEVFSGEDENEELEEYFEANDLNDDMDELHDSDEDFEVFEGTEEEVGL